VSIADPRPDMQQRRCDQGLIVSHPALQQSLAGCDTRVRRTLIFFNRIVNALKQLVGHWTCQKDLNIS